MNILWGLLIALLFPIFSYSKEELVVVQTISQEKKSIVIQKGLSEGITKGQEYLFGNENISIILKSIEVTRDYSLWVPREKSLLIPFNKNDIVAINSNTFDHMAYKNTSNENSNEAIEKNKTVETEINLAKENIDEFIWSFHYGYGGAINQTSSSVSSTQNSNKKTEDLSLEYQFKYNTLFDLAFGIRYDNEIYRITSPTLDVTTNRVIATAALIYQLPHTKIFKDNLFATLQFGIGNSKTMIDGNQSSGLTNILPAIKIGYNFKNEKQFYFFSELGVESIYASEKFDNGTKQETSQVNTKLNVGIKF